MWRSNRQVTGQDWTQDSLKQKVEGAPYEALVGLDSLIKLLSNFLKTGTGTEYVHVHRVQTTMNDDDSISCCLRTSNFMTLQIHRRYSRHWSLGGAGSGFRSGTAGLPGRVFCHADANLLLPLSLTYLGLTSAKSY